MGLVEEALWADDRDAGIRYAAVGAAIGAVGGRFLGSTAAAVSVTTAGRQLRTVAGTIGEHLVAGDLESARAALPSLVGRDPSTLDASGMAAAVIESVAENTVDAVYAPALWAVLGWSRRHRHVPGAQHDGRHGRPPQRALRALRLGGGPGRRRRQPRPGTGPRARRPRPRPRTPSRRRGARRPGGRPRSPLPQRRRRRGRLRRRPRAVRRRRRCATATAPRTAPCSATDPVPRRPTSSVPCGSPSGPSSPSSPPWPCSGSSARAVGGGGDGAPRAGPPRRRRRAGRGSDRAAGRRACSTSRPASTRWRPTCARRCGRALDHVDRYPDDARATAALAEAMGVDCRPARAHQRRRRGDRAGRPPPTHRLGGRVRLLALPAPPASASIRPVRAGGPTRTTRPAGWPPTDDAAEIRDEAFYLLATGTWTRGDEGATVLGSLTKAWAIPGVRVGYVLARDDAEADAIRALRPRWSVNGPRVRRPPRAARQLAEPGRWRDGIASLRAELIDLLGSPRPPGRSQRRPLRVGPRCARGCATACCPTASSCATAARSATPTPCASPCPAQTASNASTRALTADRRPEPPMTPHALAELLARIARSRRRPRARRCGPRRR